MTKHSGDLLNLLVIGAWSLALFLHAPRAVADESPRTFTNPILSGFYPDPSICHVGDDYYLVNSTFEYFPGVPIFHSRDLVHWRQIGHVLTRPSQLPLDKMQASGGIFAPTLRYHDGTFYLVTTNVWGTGNFYVTATDPAGLWSEPHPLDQEGIDPSLFFDDDGTVYYIRHVGGGDGYIGQQVLDLKTGKLQGEMKKIWGGTGGVWAEGPHMFKKDGHYYLMISEGGTSYDHMVTIARSDSPWGPFEACPHNPILTHRNRRDHAVQALGHADLVETPAGWWAVCLGIRPQGGRFHHMGRETFLAPVTWGDDGWPTIGNGGTIELEMAAPDLPPQPSPAKPSRDEFDSHQLGFEWNFLRNPRDGDWSLTERPGFLRLNGSAVTMSDQDSPAFVGRRQTALGCIAAASVLFEPKHENEEAGLVLRGNDNNYYQIGIALHEGHRHVFNRWVFPSRDKAQRRGYVPLPPGEVILSIKARPNDYEVRYQLPGSEPVAIAAIPTREYSSEKIGGFTGAYIGMYATGNGKPSTVPADFDWFEYTDAGDIEPSHAAATDPLPPPLKLSTADDHRAMMKELGIKSLRPGANPNDPRAPNAVNYDESKAAAFGDLPDPLVLKDGSRVTTPAMWWNERRADIVEDFDREIYGRVPADAPRVTWNVTSEKQETKAGLPVIVKKLVGHVDNSFYPLIDVGIDLTLTTPADAVGPVPVMLEFGFQFPPGWRRPNSNRGRSEALGTESDWRDMLLAKGWGYATVIPTSIQADNGAGLTSGVIGLVNRGQTRRPDDWGALRAWAWGASCALDYFETDAAVDAGRVGITGLSRYGKAALVAMAYDQRFAIGLIGSSGEGGAKLHRRNFGEIVENLTGQGGYHWMAGNFLKYGGPLTAADLPVDAHELIALCAPRPIFISYGASEGPGAEGQWVDQRGSFLATVAAGPVYRLLGKKDLGTTEFPPLEQALVDGELAFRQHAGGHTTGPNWPTFLAWADRYVQAPTPASASPTAWAARPVPQSTPLFLPAHEMLLKKKSEGVIDIYFLGDSITRRWQGTDYPEHKENWDKNFYGWNAADFGWGGDTTQNALWRLQNGELDGVHPKIIVLMIGTNNVGNVRPEDEDARADDVSAGIRAILDLVRKQAPTAKIILTAITPRNDDGRTDVMPTIDKINARIARFADGESILFLNINDKLADDQGKLFPGVTEDGLHLSIKGYQIWADALKPLFTQWLGPPAEVDKAPPASGVPEPKSAD